MKKILLAVLVAASSASANLTIVESGQKPMNLGKGYDSEKNQDRGRCIKFESEDQGQNTGTFNFTQSMDKSRVEKELGFGAGGRWRYGAATMSARADFMKNSSSDGFSISQYYGATYVFKKQLLKTETIELTEEAKKLLGKAQFRESCGDQFVEAIGYGAKLMFAIRFEFVSQEEKQRFDASFNYSSKMAEASAYLKQVANSFSQRSSVTVSAFQMGGDVSKVTDIFGRHTDGNSSGSATFIRCSFGNFEECQKALENAIKYASDTQSGFPSQLQDRNRWATLEYYTVPYEQGLVISPLPRIVTAAIQQAREDLESSFDLTLDYVSKSRRILTDKIPLSPQQRERLLRANRILESNLKKLVQAAQTCYDRPADCLEVVAALQSEGKAGLEEFERGAIDTISPETWLQYCYLGSGTVGSPEVSETIRAFVDYFATNFPDRYQRVVSAPGSGEGSGPQVDKCQVTEDLIRSQTAIDLGRKIDGTDYVGAAKVRTLWPIAEFQHLEELALMQQTVRDLSPLARWSKLTKLDVSGNEIRRLPDLQELQSLTDLNLAFNLLRDAEEARTVPNLERLDVRGNLVPLDCPSVPSLKVCLKSNLGLEIDVAGNTDLIRPVGFLASAVKLGADRVLVVGSGDSVGSFSDILTVDETSGRQVHMGQLQFTRYGHTMTAVDQNRALIIGGWGGAQRIEEVDVATGQVSRWGATLPTGVGFHSATRLQDGKILVLGGAQPNGSIIPDSVFDTAFLIDPGTQSVRSVGPMRSPRAFHTATLLEDGRVLIVGGIGAGKGLRSMEIFDPATNTFRMLKSGLVYGRAFHTATLLSDGKRAVIAGGTYDLRNGVREIEVVDLESESVSIGPDRLRVPRMHHFAVLSESGELLIGGGTNYVHVPNVSPVDCGIEYQLPNPEAAVTGIEVKSPPKNRICHATLEAVHPEDLSVHGIRAALSQPRAWSVVVPVQPGKLKVIGGTSSVPARTYDTITIRRK